MLRDWEAQMLENLEKFIAREREKVREQLESLRGTYASQTEEMKHDAQILQVKEERR